ncbi:hypothetical protein L3V82_06695 [Thiotrichales bacterium 19S3-7]|nr:hypothetical protein [Thiotrichales bacterium 19S3-7]MCF6801786.1 hypothetical protein [Thiotrichales bacterium 19S3-11]
MYIENSNSNDKSKGGLSEKEINNAEIFEFNDKELLTLYNNKSNLTIENLKQYKIDGHNLAIPDSGSVVNYVFVKPSANQKLFPNGAKLNLNHIKQRSIGECFFDAALLSIINSNPLTLFHSVRDNGDRVYVKLYDIDRDGNKTPVIYDIEKSTLKGTGRPLLNTFNEHELWAGILEKAYAIHQYRRFYNATNNPENRNKNLEPITAPLTTFINGGFSHDVFNVFFETNAYSVNFQKTEVNESFSQFEPIQLYIKTVLKDDVKKIESDIKQLKSLDETGFTHQQRTTLNTLINAFNGLLQNPSDLEDNLLHLQSISKMLEHEELSSLKNILSSKAPNLERHFNNLAGLSDLGKQPQPSDRFKKSLADFMQQALTSGYIISVSTKHDFGKKIPLIPEQLSNGVASGHAYGCLKVKSSSDGQITLTVINPWQKYSSEYKENGQLTSQWRSDTKQNKDGFDKNHLVISEELNQTINGGAPTIHIQNAQGQQTQFFGVSEIKIEDFFQYFDSIYFVKPTIPEILLNQIYTITLASSRNGFNNQAIADIANFILTSMDSDKSPNTIYANILNYIDKTLEGRSFGATSNLQSSERDFKSMLDSLSNKEYSSSEVIKSLASTINKVRQHTPAMSYYEFIEQLDHKINPTVTDNFCPVTKAILMTYWHNSLKNKPLSQRLTLDDQKFYKLLLNDLLDSLQSDLEYDTIFNIGHADKIKGLINELNAYDKLQPNNKSHPKKNTSTTNHTSIMSSSFFKAPSDSKTSPDSEAKSTILEAMKEAIQKMIKNEIDYFGSARKMLSQSAKEKLQVLNEINKELTELDIKNDPDGAFKVLCTKANSAYKQAYAPGISTVNKSNVNAEATETVKRPFEYFLFHRQSYENKFATASQSKNSYS